MPVYEYECDDCRKRFDLKQRFDDEAIGICPICAGKAHRLFHSVPIVFKGSGFYSTDYTRSSVSSSASELKDKGEETAVSKGGKEEREDSKQGFAEAQGQA